MESQEHFNKYLYEAELSDGSVFVQPEDDHSELEPGVRTSFYDLLEKSKTNPIKRFSIWNTEHHLSVDLTTGNFTKDGVEILVQHEIPIENPRFKLIYHRTILRHFNVDMEEKSAECAGYFIGWECVVKRIIDGKEVPQSYKYILGLK